MALTIDVNGVRYERMISLRVYRTIEAVCGSFSLETSAQADNLIPVKLGDRVKVLADGITILNGFAEDVSISHDSGQHMLTVTGRDRTCDIVDSSVVNNLEFTGPVQFESIIRSVLDSLNLQSIGIVNESGTIEPFTSDDVVSANVGEGAFDFLNRYAEKRQVLLSTDGLGNVLIVRGQGATLPVRLVYGENILSSQCSFENSRRYNRYVYRSQLNPISLDASTPASDISEQVGEAIDSSIRNSRITVIDAPESMDNENCGRRATLEANLRRANSLTYSCVVQGHSIPGSENIWRPNRIVKAVDPLCGIDAELLIKTCRWYYDSSGGSRTGLQMTYKDAYTLQAEVDRLDAQKNDYGSGF